MSRHINIPIFIPHLGCKNQCVFCNQRIISGKQEFRLDEVENTINEVLSTVSSTDEVEIAFFGGSFTGIDRNLMITLLEIASKYIESGQVKSIRVSTRPDYIDNEILDILEKYGVTDIELGLQSVCDEVLRITKRGHTKDAAERASRLTVSRGFNLVGQMMLGLPASTLENELETADFIINSGAKAARIYPTVVFRDTELCDFALKGEYTPLSTEEAVRRAVKVARRFIENGVEILRIGLCSSENLSSGDTYFAGPNHSALGELIMGEIYYENILSALEEKHITGGDITVFLPKGSLSKGIGQNKRNKIRLIREKGFDSVRFEEDNSLSPYRVRVE